MNEYTGFDLDSAIDQAWNEFGARLSEVIAVIDDSADLTIGTPTPDDDQSGAPFLRYSSPSRDVIRCEAASNAVLDPDDQLSDQQVADMVALGWQTGSSDDHQPSGNFTFVGDQANSEQISELAVKTLRDVYGVLHPTFLAPDQLAEILQPRPQPLLSGEFDADDVVATIPSSPEHLDELIEAELVEKFGHPPFRDHEGDIAVRVGSVMIFLRRSADGREIVVFSTVVLDVEGRSRATEVLNDVNVEARWVKFQLVRDRVFVTHSVHAHPFVPAHLHQAFRTVSDVADAIDDDLAAKLRGRTTFEDGPVQE